PNLTTANRLREQIYDLQPKVKPMSGRKHLLPVCYGGDFGPDLEEVAENLKIKPKQLVELHQATSYRVYQLGYQPGFAFLGLTDPQLEIERRQSPRSKVPAGSVGLAGRQTGIYPMETPGGWQLIGRCPWSMIRTNREPFARLQAGDVVEFYAIEAEQWTEYLENRVPWTD
ncbi:MAG: 5-oxoprolinase subunit PxpB, partial [Bacteroidota bacterium]